MKTLTRNLSAVLKPSFMTAFIMFIAGFILAPKAKAQCPNNNAFYTSISTLNPGQSYVFGCVWGGEYVTIPVVAGSQYTFSTCGGGSWDTQLTIYNNTGGPALGYNDDFCGLQSRIVWTSTFSGTLRILLDQYSCASNQSCMNITVTRANSAVNYNPCSNIASLNCNGTTNANITSGNGAWDNYGGPYSTPGRERLFSFTPSVSGLHNIAVSHSSNTGWIDLFYKTASSGCNSSGWTFVTDIYQLSSYSTGLNLTAGVTYYFMLDDEDANGSNATISLTCPAPCVGPVNGVDFIFTAPFNHSSTTANACNDCSFRSSNERTYQVNITCPGTYVFSLCNNTTWDTYMYLTTQACGGTTLALNDDFCGLQSQITANLNVGTYYVTIEGFGTASNGAYQLNVTGGGTPISGSAVISGANNVCSGSSSNYNVSGVSGATSYNWSVAGGVITSGQGSSNITVNWTSGSGLVSVIPVSACGNGSQANYNVTINAIPVINVTSNNVTCNGLGNGSILVSPANSNWVYSINGGASYGSSNSFNNLTPGNYNVIAQVVNLQGCSSTSQFIQITQPSVLSNVISTSNFNGFGISCNGGSNGSATVAVTGGTQPYNYAWSNNTSGSTANNLTAGAYNVTVTDANGCVTSGSANLTQPSAMFNTPSTSNYNGYGVSCFGGNNGSASANVTGGVSPYNYTWSNNGTSQTINNLTAGNYNVVVTDANGCVVGGNVTITQPAALSNNVTSSNYNGYGVSCFGGNNGSASANVSGGVSPYSYAWSNNATSSNITNLSAGNYNVVVTDANGCTIGGNANITQPAALSNNVVTSNYNGYGVSCFGGNNGSASSNVSGGVSPYSYSWSNNATSSNITNLSAGNYNVVVTDANGCTIGGNANITQPTQLTLNMGPNQVVYYGYTPSSCANITSSANGGVPNYNYSWSNNTNQSNATVCPSVTTVYTVTVTDANGCSTSGTVKVCAINVICYAGNSNVAKVQVCHIPPGNNQNPQTICINASAVPAHLAQGSYLGACNVSTVCSNNSNRGIAQSEDMLDVQQSISDLNVYPNPARSSITFEYYCFVNGKTNVEIRDITGRLMIKGSELDSEAHQTRVNTLNVDEFAPGVYFLTIKHNGNSYTKKFVIEK